MSEGRWIGWLLLACACTPGSGTSTSDGSSGDSSTTQGPGASESTEGRTDPGQTSTPTIADTTAGMDTTAGTETGQPDECDFPQPEAIECQPPGTTTLDVTVLVDGMPLQEDAIEQTCTVAGVVDDGMSFALQLDCPAAMVEVTITSTPHQPLLVGMGESLDLSYSAYLEDEANIAHYLSLRYPGGTLLFAAFDASTIPTPAQLDLSPLTIELPPTTCEPVLMNKFIIYLQQAGLRVTYDGQTVDVFANGDEFVGALSSYRVLTDELRRIHCFPEDSLGYNYATWFTRAAFFLIPEG